MPRRRDAMITSVLVAAAHCGTAMSNQHAFQREEDRDRRNDALPRLPRRCARPDP